MTRAKDGDTEAFGLLYVAYAEKMKGVCINILRHDTDVADDLVHDAFVVAFIKCDYFFQILARISPWEQRGKSQGHLWKNGNGQHK